MQKGAEEKQKLGKQNVERRAIAECRMKEEGVTKETLKR